MDKLQQLLNFCNESGKAITFFDGRITLSQLLAVVCTMVVVSFALTFLKKIMRTIVVIAAVCFGLIHFGLASPTQIKDVAQTIAENGIATYTKIANSSENIRIKDNSLEIFIEGHWYNLASISSMVQTSDGVATVNIEGEDYVISDPSVVSLLKSFN